MNDEAETSAEPVSVPPGDEGDTFALARATRAGAAGFVVNDTPPEQLVESIRRVHAGLRVIDPSLAA